MWGVCRTEGCSNKGWPIDVGDLTGTNPETGEPDPTVIKAVACGVCEQPITDIEETKPPDPVIEDDLGGVEEFPPEGV